MKVGQTSFILFVSRILSSVAGFVGTVIFARVLGASVLGQFALTLTVVSWLMIVADSGVSSAIAKRVSEGTEQSEYTVAGLVIIAGVGVLLALFGVGFRTQLNQYVGDSVAFYLLVLLIIALGETVVTSVLNGQHSVHIVGYLNVIKIVGRVGTQLLLVFAGLGLTGLLVGQAVGWSLSAVIGTLFVRVQLRRPSRRHFKRLFEYIRYAWVGRLKSRSFNEVDILLLGVFTQQSLVGVYSVAWGISKFLSTFDGAISQTIFPEISNADANADTDYIGTLLTDALRFSGLIHIPGLVGGLLIGDRLLQIYGPEFEQGTAVLTVLIAATLLFGYQKQLLTGLNAIDRPDLSFRINLFFIIFNALANVGLIYVFGWVGAAVATALSAGGGILATYWVLQKQIGFSVPYQGVLKQVIAAVFMGGVILGGRRVIRGHSALSGELLTVLVLVLIGAAVYFSALLIVSHKFRSALQRNLPGSLPYV